MRIGPGGTPPAMEPMQPPPVMPVSDPGGRTTPGFVAAVSNIRGDPVSKVRAIQPRDKVTSNLDTPTDLSQDAVEEISEKLNAILADSFALYLKTKNFHWHVSGPHFRDYHLLLDEQAAQIFASTDEIAERVRKIGGTTLRSIGHVSKLQSIEDNDDEYVSPGEMLRELMADNKKVVAAMREAHKVCDDNEDVATASQLEVFIDQAERRLWFMFEASRTADRSGH
jgi:starvation-inducible DNA-binding protein